MNKKSLYIGLLIIVFISTALFGWIKFNETAIPTQQLSNVEVLNETHTALILKKANFESLNEFIEKALIIEGSIKKIDLNDTYNIMLLTEDKILVSCKFQKDQNDILKTYNEGDKIKIKGIYKGALNYLILLNCIIENN